MCDRLPPVCRRSSSIERLKVLLDTAVDWLLFEVTKKMEQTPLDSSSRGRGTPDETGLEEVQTEITALKRLYGLLHKGPADGNLDETSRACLMRILDDAAQKALRRQSKMISGSPTRPAPERNLSIPSDCRTRAAKPSQSLNPPASPSLSLHQVSERLHRFNLHRSPSSSRDGRHVSYHRRAAEEPVLSRLASNRSSRTAMPLRPCPSREQPSSAASRRPMNLHHSTSSSCDGRQDHGHRRDAEEALISCLASDRSLRTEVPSPHHSSRGQPSSGLILNRFSVSATSRHGTVTGKSSLADLRDRTRPSNGHGDHSSSLEARMLSRGLERPHGYSTVRHKEAEGSFSTRHFRRVDMASHHGSERAGRGVATPRCSSSASSNAVATIHSHILRPHRELTERFLRRCEEEEDEESTPRLRREGDTAVSSVGWSSCKPRRTLNSIDSGSTYRISSSGAASSFTYMSSTVSPACSASVSSYSSPVSRRRNARPAYTSEASESLRSRRRRRERKEKREGRLRKLVKKIAMVFHHRHDHHHHHHYPRGQEGPPKSDRCTLNRKSRWKHLGGMFHRKKGQDKKTASQTTVSVPAKKRGGGGHVHDLFGGMRRLRGKRKAPASVKMKKMASRVQVKKMHWWQQLRKRHGKARRRLRHGKAV